MTPKRTAALRAAIKNAPSLAALEHVVRDMGFVVESGNECFNCRAYAVAGVPIPHAPNCPAARVFR